MKIILLLLPGIFYFLAASSQITIPVIKANFGVDADLRANYFNGTINSAGDDWFNNGTAGTGQFMIDTTGASAIVAGYTSNPASRMWSFTRLMRPPAYSTVNNRLVLDAIFYRDFHGTDSTVFASGSNKNGMSPANWSCPVAQNIPDKNDILDVFTHIRRAGPNVTDSLWMFGGISIQNTNGNRYFDFELYQTDIFYNRTLRQFGGFGPDDGHTAWLFDAAGNVLKAGDIIFSAEFGGSSLSLIQARIWVHQSALAITPVNFNWGGQFDGAGSGATYGYASILPKTTGDFYTGIQSVNGVWAGPFSLVLQDNTVVPNYVANQFLEISINLTKLGIDPGNFSSNPCGAPYRRVMIKTRASSAFTAELKDFVAPFRMFDYPGVIAYKETSYFCEVFPPTLIYVQNPNPTSIYNWSTTNGNIIGPTNGTSITVNAPGTYYVTQQLHLQCPVFSIDSALMFFDSICGVLDIKLYDFNVRRFKNDASLTWRVSNNQAATNFEIEYSYNNIDFISQAVVPASDKINQADYSIYVNLLNNHAAVIYYRIKINTRNGRIKYSNIIAARITDFTPGYLTVSPNPVTGVSWLSFTALQPEIAEITISNAQGSMISSFKAAIRTGNNRIMLPNLSKNSAGLYYIQLKLKNGSFSRKIQLH